MISYVIDWQDKTGLTDPHMHLRDLQTHTIHGLEKDWSTVDDRCLIGSECESESEFNRQSRNFQHSRFLLSPRDSQARFIRHFSETCR
jgi:hypothetical protein